ncbi:MAG: rhomboid family intramembrane serine protease [Cyanobacteria bacterium SZAS TMP-1]|nr:rhomboid family intramembrane serine protease [Cyanobacteria bacterium SZAS TMP-1]
MLPLSDAENQSSTIPYVNVLLIVANIAAFIGQAIFVSDSPAEHKLALETLAVVPSRFLAHFSVTEFATIFTSMFMHGGLGHIAGNLWFLFIFGDNVEDRMGHTNYLLFYLTCGALGGLTHILTHPHDTIGCIGASGAISGVMAAYLVLFPGVQVKTWMTWFWQPMVSAWLLIGFWFFIQLASSYMEAGTPGGTAFFAHIGGFVFGILLLRLCLKRQGPPESDEQLPMPFFVSAALVVYGAAAIGFSVYRANTAPVVPATTNVIAPAIKLPQIDPAPAPHAHSNKATHKHHKTQASGH